MAIDDNTIYGLYGSQIKDLPEKINAVKGKAKELTSADYNWHSTGDVNNSIAAWLLPDGLYVVKDSPVVWFTTSYNDSGLTFIKGTNSVGVPYLLTINNAGTVAQYTLRSNGSTMNERPILKQSDIVDNLTSTSTTTPLSANQGKVLKDFIGDLTALETTAKTSAVAAINELVGTVEDIQETEPASGSGAPSSSTEGTIGQTYVDTSTGDVYVLTEIIEESGSYSYVWTSISGGGASVVTLTSADYNYPTDNPTRVAVWMLADGVYSAPSADLAISTSTNVGYGYRFIKAGNTIFTWSNGGENRIYIVSSSSGSQSAVYDLAPPTVVQTTGTSTTDVMSQNAVTSMVFADPSARKRVQIGAGASTDTNNQIAIGPNASCSNSSLYSIALGHYAANYAPKGITIGENASCFGSADNSVALGSDSKATQKGQVDISTLRTTNTDGYNNSQYRLLTGVYDGQSPHDAATKGQLDSAVTGIESELDSKQDVLTAGQGISIADESGALVISSTGGGAETFTTNEWNALWA